MKNKILVTLLVSSFFLVSACTDTEIVDSSVSESAIAKKKDTKESSEDTSSIEEAKDISSKPIVSDKQDSSDLFEGYRLIEVDGGDLSGHREANVMVNIGFWR